jgi:FlaA1/EpsC-like NDP-sugar epimerase
MSIVQKAPPLRHRRVLVVFGLLGQVGLAAASNYLAFLLRFDGILPDVHVEPFLRGLPILLCLRAAALVSFRLHRGLWRYASVWDLQNIVSAVGLSSIFFALIVNVIVDIGPYPRSIHFIDSVLLIVFLGGVRMLRRAYHEFDRVQTERRVLIFGAGDAGELIVRDMKNNRFYNCEPVGFVDDDIEKVGRSIHGVPVLGTREDLARILEREKPDEVLVAIPRAQPSQIRGILRSLEPFKIPIKTLPNLSDVLAGRVELKQIRNLSLEDLLTRQPVGLDQEPVRKLVNGRRVLVTGAGGSIGSELSRQLAALGPSHLLVLDQYENTLFQLCGALSHTTSCAFTPIIADIADERRIDRVFRTMRPDIVFHAAAHKHVPLMETNPAEAVKNNVAGTRIVAVAAMRNGVSEFVLISSDKAVNPSSVMGATKRVAELIVRSYAEESRTRFMAVRFGNVLGSNGSVAPIFEQQIARGGPVTVTHPEMRRYFMLIPEAVSLVLHAAASQDTNTIYALDMGEQIPLVDFARNMIRLAGYVPDEDIAITFTGIRPGEKLCEELWEDTESGEMSSVAQVFRVRSTPVPANIHSTVARLESAASAEHDDEVLRLLSEIVPTFRTAPPAAVSPLAAVPRSGAFPQGVSSVGL